MWLEDADYMVGTLDRLILLSHCGYYDRGGHILSGDRVLGLPIFIMPSSIKVDPELRKEVLARYEKLNLAPYKGFVNPRYEAVTDASGDITYINVIYGEVYIDQMLRCSRDYSVE